MWAAAAAAALGAEEGWVCGGGEGGQGWAGFRNVGGTGWLRPAQSGARAPYPPLTLLARRVRCLTPEQDRVEVRVPGL